MLCGVQRCQLSEPPTSHMELVTPTSLNAIVTPGQVVGRYGDEKGDSLLPLRLGNGLFANGTEIKASKAGILRRAKSSNCLSFWVDNDQKTYSPCQGDLVIGLITDKLADSYRVDIGGPFLATLPALAFEGATKRNRPILAIKSLVYCRIVVADKDMEPEVACTMPNHRQGSLGPLNGGNLLACSLATSQELLLSTTMHKTWLAAAAAFCPFELVVGANGRLWLQSSSVSFTAALSRCFMVVEHSSASDMMQIVRSEIANADNS
jgi:exosome complex component RRP40